MADVRPSSLLMAVLVICQTATGYEDFAPDVSNHVGQTAIAPAATNYTPASPPVLYWKLRKVAGSTVCLILERYASQRGLRITSPDAATLRANLTASRGGGRRGLYKRRVGFSTGVLPLASASGRGSDRMSPPRRQLLRYEHNTDCAKLGPADDVVCCHNLGQRASQRDAFIASKPDLLQVVTLRDPGEQLVSVYHYRQQALGRDPFKPPDRLQADAFIRQTWSRYLLDWAPTGEAGNAMTALNELKRNSTQLLVLIFEAMDESLVLLLDRLGLGLEEGVKDWAKRTPHATLRWWPRDSVQLIKSYIRQGRLQLVYDTARQVFERQVDAFGRDKMTERVTELRRLRASYSHMHREDARPPSLAMDLRP